MRWPCSDCPAVSPEGVLHALEELNARDAGLRHALQVQFAYGWLLGHSMGLEGLPVDPDVETIVRRAMASMTDSERNNLV